MRITPSGRSENGRPFDWRPAQNRPPAQDGLRSSAVGQTRPLRAVVLDSAGQDVTKCSSCSHCERYLEPGMDLSFGQIIQAALRDDPAAMTSHTLWTCDDLLESHPLCRSGIDLASVVLALRSEAEARGLTLRDGTPLYGTDQPARETGS